MSARPLAPALVAALLALSPPLAARDDEAAPPETDSTASEPVAATTDATKN